MKHLQHLRQVLSVLSHTAGRGLAVDGHISAVGELCLICQQAVSILLASFPRIFLFAVLRSLKAPLPLSPICLKLKRLRGGVIIQFGGAVLCSSCESRLTGILYLVGDPPNAEEMALSMQDQLVSSKPLER